jgi:glycosyltransferase involved in cell wall biosynthesis
VRPVELPDECRVSIVTPSLNQARFLELAVESVLQQECDFEEYWVVDGGSQDGSVDLLRQYDSRLHWVSEPDSGQGDAINKGFQRSRGEIIGWLNADDVYCPGALNEVAGSFGRIRTSCCCTVRPIT